VQLESAKKVYSSSHFTVEFTSMLLFWPYLVTFLLALTIALQSIPKVKAIASHYGYLDVPSARKVHNQPIVRLGGVAICLGTLVSLGIIWSLGGMQVLSDEINAKFTWLLVGSFAFFLIGLADDLFNLAAALRLFLQFSIAGLVWLGGVQIEFLSIPGVGVVELNWLSLPLTLLWLTGVVNAINWIDGLDGLAAGISTIACGAIFVVALAMQQPLAALVIAALAGSLLGFLRYNFNPAQIFMGDGGSYFVGFLLAGVSVLGLLKGTTAVVILPLILAVPILDMSAVIAARLGFVA
jgi:UDP-GlcNAc:undecaprenyl-phosphate/decaprenyl-phosphate GlcNAc-1-phosphate transferase